MSSLSQQAHKKTPPEKGAFSCRVNGCVVFGARLQGLMIEFRSVPFQTEQTHESRCDTVKDSALLGRVCCEIHFAVGDVVVGGVKVFADVNLHPVQASLQLSQLAFDPGLVNANDSRTIEHDVAVAGVEQGFCHIEGHVAVFFFKAAAKIDQGLFVLEFSDVNRVLSHSLCPKINRVSVYGVAGSWFLTMRVKTNIVLWQGVLADSLKSVSLGFDSVLAPLPAWKAPFSFDC